MPKKLLMIASTISPRWGSEGAVGWCWLRKIPTPWEADILTTKECASEIRWGIRNGHTIPFLKTIESPPLSWKFKHKNKFLARLNEVLKYSYNLKQFKKIAKDEQFLSQFDIIHQTTIATWMQGMPFHSLGVPTVWGPIGGGEQFPWKYLFETSFINWIFEGGRLLSSKIAQLKSIVVSSVKNVDVIICTNKQTEGLLRSMGRTKPIVLQPMVISNERFHQIHSSVKKKASSTLKIISGGSIEGRKGFALTIKALKKLKQSGIPFEFTVAGQGMELTHLSRLVGSLGLEGEVFFETDLDTNSYIKKLCESHVFCFPSLRDNSPLTLIEGMAAECVPIVLDNGGPSEAVNSNCGYVLPLESPQETIKKISDILSYLHFNRMYMNCLIKNGVDRIRSIYIDDCITKIMRCSYDLALESRNCRNCR